MAFAAPKSQWLMRPRTEKALSIGLSRNAGALFGLLQRTLGRFLPSLKQSRRTPSSITHPIQFHGWKLSSSLWWESATERRRHAPFLVFDESAESECRRAFQRKRSRQMCKKRKRGTMKCERLHQKRGNRCLNFNGVRLTKKIPLWWRFYTFKICNMQI